MANARSCRRPICGTRRRMSRAIIRTGWMRASPPYSARRGSTNCRRWRHGRRSICGSTRSRPTVTERLQSSASTIRNTPAGRPSVCAFTSRRMPKVPAIQSDPAFIKGHVEIQDEGSQLAALLSGARPGEQVVDLCAGAGGKTLALVGDDGEFRPALRHRYRQAPAGADPCAARARRRPQCAGPHAARGH